MICSVQNNSSCSFRASVDLHLDLIGLAIGAGGFEDVDVGFAEDHDQVALAAVGQILLHVQVGIHAGHEHGDGAKLGELVGPGLVVEGRADQQVEASVSWSLDLATSCSPHDICTRLSI